MYLTECSQNDEMRWQNDEITNFFHPVSNSYAPMGDELQDIPARGDFCIKTEIEFSNASNQWLAVIELSFEKEQFRLLSSRLRDFLHKHRMFAG